MTMEDIWLSHQSNSETAFTALFETLTQLQVLLLQCQII